MINQINNKTIQCRAIRGEFEPVGPTLLKDPLHALWWGGLLVFPSSREKISQSGIEPPTPPFRFWVPLHCHPLV